MINNGIGMIKLENGGILRLDIDDYEKYKNDKWRWVRRTGDAIFVISSNGLGGGKSRYLHKEMGMAANGTKKLVFINGDRLDYRRKNLVQTQYPKYEPNVFAKKVGRKYYTIEGNILGVMKNRAIIQVDKERSLVCAMCSLIDVDMYAACLDVAADENWPGWKSLGGPGCVEVRELLNEEGIRSASSY